MARCRWFPHLQPSSHAATANILMATTPFRQRIRSAIGSVVRRRLRRSRDRFLETASLNCRQVQQRTLHRILALNSDSDFSVRNGLQPNLTAEQFRRQFAVADYEVFRSPIQQMVAGNHQALLGRRNKLLMYALTSGTTARAKHIPITRQFVKDYRRGWQHWGISVHESHPSLKLLKMVQLNSRHEIYCTTDGVPCGNISGLVTAMQSPIIRKLYSIPASVTHVDHPVERRLIAARFAVADQWVGMFVTANPSSLISLLQAANDNCEGLIKDIADGVIRGEGLSDELRRQLSSFVKPNQIRAQQLERIVETHGSFVPNKVWPHCCVLGVWTGGSVSAYLPELQRRFGNLPIRDHGLHASEGRMTIPFEDNCAAGILDIESHYFEFIPEAELASSKPTTLAAHELHENETYGILLTTCSGLYRYNIHDVVRCTGFHGSTPKLEFLHKAAHISSITGEKITESQVVAAVKDGWAEALSDRNAASIFTMTPAWGEPPGYELYVSQNLNERQRDALAIAVDRSLASHNCEYEEKRSSGRLRCVSCRLLTDVQWRRLTEYRMRVAGGSQEQYKHPFLLPDPKFERRLDRAIAAGGKGS